MRILFVIRDMVTGGAGKQLALTANALQAKGHSVYVFTYFGGPLQHKLKEGVRYIAQDPVPRSKFAEYLLTPVNIRRQLKALKPDVAISWRCNAGCFTVLAALGVNVKTIFSERTDPYTETSFALKISEFVCNFSSGGVFQLERVRQFYKRLYNKSVVIHNPFDNDVCISDNIPYADRPKEIVHVARVEIALKRQDLALEAFRKFLETNPDYTLHFYGDGHDIEKIKTMTSNFGLKGNVCFHGSVKDVPEKIKNAKCLLLTSAYEGIPNVILEAFAAGVPVVSTDCSPGGARMLLGENENGLIVKGFNPEDIAHALSEVVNNNELAIKYEKKGRNRLCDFAPEEIFNKWNSYLEGLVYGDK